MYFVICKNMVSITKPFLFIYFFFKYNYCVFVMLVFTQLFFFSNSCVFFIIFIFIHIFVFLVILQQIKNTYFLLIYSSSTKITKQNTCKKSHIKMRYITSQTNPKMRYKFCTFSQI